METKSDAAAAILRAEGVSRTFGKGDSAVHALRGATMRVYPGDLIALRGRSGSGKTTLLNLLAALDTPTDGDIYYGDRNVGKLTENEKNELRKKEIGLIFQSFALVPYMSAYENVDFGLRVAGIDKKERRRLAEEALTFVGLGERMHHMPQEMSGGEQQRTAIARAIAHRPSIVLADEPTAELDSAMGLQVLRIFRSLAEKEGIGIILTTHDPAIMEVVNEVYGLEDGQIVQDK